MASDSMRGAQGQVFAGKVPKKGIRSPISGRLASKQSEASGHRVPEMGFSDVILEKGRRILSLLHHHDSLLDMAAMPQPAKGSFHSAEFFLLSQGEIVRDPEQRSTYRHLVFIAWRVNNHYPGRYQTKARREMWFCPSPDNSPMGAAQRQRKINRWRTEQNSPELPPGNENSRVAGGHLLVYLKRNQIRTANRQRTRFDMRPYDHLVNQVAQFSIITVVAALNVEGATDCDRSLTPPLGKTRRNAVKTFCASRSFHILGSFSQFSRMFDEK